MSEEGLFPCGVSQDHRPDVPQITSNLSVLDPLGMPLTTTVLSGERADDPLSGPEITRVQQRLGCQGMPDIGECNMGSLETRAYVEASHDYDLCPLAGVQMPVGTLEELLQPVLTGQQPVRPVYRPDEPKDQPQERIAEGFECSRELTADLNGRPIQWTERRCIVRSVRYATSQEKVLRACVDKALTAIDALNQRSRGKKRFTEESERQVVCQKIVETDHVERVISLTCSNHTTSRRLRRDKNRPEPVRAERDVSVRAHVDQNALEAQINTLDWRVYVTNQPHEQLSLDQVVLAYREQCVIESSLGRLKHKSLSLTPMYLTSDDRVRGLVRLLTIGLRVLTLSEFLVRRTLSQEGTKLSGMYSGNPKRATARPTTEMMLNTFKELTLTLIQQEHGRQAPVPPLSQVHTRILELIGISQEMYLRLTQHFSKPMFEMSER